MRETEITIPVATVRVSGNLTIPKNAKGLVLFAHGSGSSRFSPRNVFVASFLHDAGCATLLLDLLTLEEEDVDEYTREFRFDIPRLATRVVDTTKWLKQNPETKDLPIGYFGSSTGAAAALVAAAELGGSIKAVVSRGGRPDLAGKDLKRVLAPTLLIVGGNDLVVLDLNKEAFQQLTCEKKLEVIPGATHLFEEPGTLEQAAKDAASWFLKHFLGVGD